MIRRGILVLAAFGVLLGAQWDDIVHRDSYFEPSDRLGGIGIDRERFTEALLAERTRQMIDSQTFSIMREPFAVAGAERITAPRLQALFRRASDSSGLPVNLLEAVAYLESWGDSRAESPAGPRGIMQISDATARRIGLKITYATRYRVTKERVLVRRKGRKPAYRTVRKKTPYTVLVRDDRLAPERAIPAAATYLAQMERRFGGRDWAVFAYHCGEGCVSEMQSITARARGVTNPPTVSQMFFLGSPAYNRELYEAVDRQMQRDYSPTYWFRVMRAQQLLQLWRDDPRGFRGLADDYRSKLAPAPRAPHRLSVWLKTTDLVYKSCEDIISDHSGRLAAALDDPAYFGYTLRRTGPHAIGWADRNRQQYYLQASPSALGALTYIAYETRRLFDDLKPAGERWQPLEVASLVEPMDYRGRLGGAPDQPEFLAHCTGQVFDLSTAGLPAGEREALRFVLDDMGWDGYLGFIDERGSRIHIGPAPTARDFFAKVFDEAVRTRQKDTVPQVSAQKTGDTHPE
jgi:hypothetical protein